MMQDQNYDLIIVGAGMAGCILAARIAENGINPRNGEPLNPDRPNIQSIYIVI